MKINIDGRILVSTLVENFKKECGGTLRVYKNNTRCDGSEKLITLATQTGTYECRLSKTVEGFEKDMKDNFGLKVQIASPDDWVLALDNMTLSNLTSIPKKATKQDMDVLKAKYGK